VINLFDARYAYRIANGFNGSHWAPGRSVFLRASATF
jgi:outer membrane receptor protein involved in Fe transport